MSKPAPAPKADAQETLKAVPDYDTACDNCGQTPVVTGVNKKGEVVFAPELCGPCCFGEADAIDPENW